MAKHLINLEALGDCEIRGHAIPQGTYQGVTIDRPDVKAEGGRAQAVFLSLTADKYVDADKALNASSVNVTDLMQQGLIVES
ncbi:hypothetical protein [Sinorhizobium meliloti]|uniref:hypothetical protein n=1 Tax=Rhizobium meliloti TaxID=382 RepID=UPI0013E2F445|nr:hypothetical protein [Sinorhizobium meliloti]